jgi:hypothetical protein
MEMSGLRSVVGDSGDEKMIVSVSKRHLVDVFMVLNMLMLACDIMSRLIPLG